MLDHRLDGLRRGAAVAAAEERAGSAAEEQGLRLVRVPRLDVPRLLPGEAALLGEANALGTLPGLAEVGRAVRGSRIAWKTSQPVRWGPSTVQSRRVSSLVTTNRPLRVPTRTATPIE